MKNLFKRLLGIDQLQRQVVEVQKWQAAVDSYDHTRTPNRPTNDHDKRLLTQLQRLHCEIKAILDRADKNGV